MRHQRFRGQFIEHGLNAVQEVLYVLPCHGADVHDGQTCRFDCLLEGGPGLLRLGQIHLVQDHELRLVQQPGIEEFHLLVDGFEIAQGVGAVAGDHVDKDTGALDVAQEVDAQTDAFVGALHEARHVGEDDLAGSRLRRRRGWAPLS